MASAPYWLLAILMALPSIGTGFPATAAFRRKRIFPQRLGSRGANSDYNRMSAIVRCFPKPRSEEHTSELQSLMRISYAVFCLKKKKHNLCKNIINHVSIHKFLK